jgi:hypothetical protein
MSRFSLIAAVVLATSGVSLAATSASAQDMRAQYSSGPYGNNGYGGGYGYGGGSDGGLGRYCPPGYYPHSFPGGNGVRCEAQDGRNIYGAPF